MDTKDNIRLYHFDACPFCEKVRRTFQLLSLDYKSHIIDPDDRSEVIQISGERGVPMIVDGDTVMNQSTKIVKYLDSTYNSGNSLIPKTPAGSGHAYLVDKFAEKVWGNLNYYATKEITRNGDKLDEAGKKSLQEKINREAVTLDDYFNGRKYAIGEQISLADLSLSAFISRMKQFSNFYVGKSYKYFWNWYQRVKDALIETEKSPV